ncbi:hypothetical protein [Thermomonas sp.]|uniref:sensor histidine kinase n=1 Tax=Thermomonas sp. TaxID=1971895 RepID=UPI00248A0510|nr:hypothetical protein [Thermomonas sp.]MDI1252924.1 hypothetical protein [Thermomonas sp.]
MDAMQPPLLASGIAVGGGLSGAAVSAFLHRQRLQRETNRLAVLLESATSVPSTRSPQLAALLAGAWQRIEVLISQGDDSAAQRRQMAADMVRLMHQSDGAMRAKDRFLASANHDLRQPLQVMDLALEQLRREALDGLLLLSQLDAGTLQAHAMACDLQPLFAELLDAQAQAARQAGVELHCQAGAHAVFTDAGMLGGLLGRLLDNALKAAPHGGRVLLAARVAAIASASRSATTASPSPQSTNRGCSTKKRQTTLPGNS